MLLLGDSGLAEVRDIGLTFEGSAGVVIDRLTMAGHDFLEAARDETRWSKAMKTVKRRRCRNCRGFNPASFCFNETIN